MAIHPPLRAAASPMPLPPAAVKPEGQRSLGAAAPTTGSLPAPVRVRAEANPRVPATFQGEQLRGVPRSARPVVVTGREVKLEIGLQEARLPVPSAARSAQAPAPAPAETPSAPVVSAQYLHTVAR